MRKKSLTRTSLLIASLFLSACLGSKQKIVPETPQAKALKTLAVAQELHQKGNYAEAKPKLLEALAQDPKLGAAHILLGRGALAQGDTDEAKAQFLKARELNPKDAEAALGLGTTYTQTGELALAEPLLLEAKTLAPSSSRVPYYLAELYAKEEKYDLAEKAYREAIQLEPGDVWPKLGLSRLLRRANPEEAKKLAEEAAALKPDLDEPYNHLGFLASDQKDYPGAEALFTKAIENNDQLPRNYMNLGTVQAWQGKLDAAKTSLEKAVALDPKYAIAYNNLGHIQRQAGRNEEAITAAQKAVELEPKIPLYHVNLGDTYSSVGRFSDAAKSYQEALALAPTQAPLARKLALALSQAGDTPGAYRALAAFIETNPADAATPALQEELTRLAKDELKSQLR